MAHAVLGPGLAFRPARTPPLTPRAPSRPVPSGGSEARKAAGRLVQCVESLGTRGTERSPAPSLPSGPARPTTLFTTRGSAQHRNAATPAYLRAVRAFLAFHWAQWPSISGVGGRACALSAAIATARLELASAAEGEGGCCASAGSDTGRGYGEC